MAPQRRATSVSVAAHSLYEQSDPITVYEPEGRLDLASATYQAIDNCRTRSSSCRAQARADKAAPAACADMRSNAARRRKANFVRRVSSGVNFAEIQRFEISCFLAIVVPPSLEK